MNSKRSMKDRTLLLDEGSIEKNVIVCQESKHTTYCGPLGMMAVEGKRGSVQGGSGSRRERGKAGIAWIRTKESLKTNGQATWVSSVLQGPFLSTGFEG